MIYVHNTTLKRIIICEMGHYFIFIKINCWVSKLSFELLRLGEIWAFPYTGHTLTRGLFTLLFTWRGARAECAFVSYNLVRKLFALQRRMYVAFLFFDHLRMWELLTAAFHLAYWRLDSNRENSTLLKLPFCIMSLSVYLNGWTMGHKARTHTCAHTHTHIRTVCDTQKVNFRMMMVSDSWLTSQKELPFLISQFL